MPKPPDRDKRVPKTPPTGVTAQIAPTVYPPRTTTDDGEWAGDTGNHPVLHGADDDTPVGMKAEEARAAASEVASDLRLKHRVKATAQTVENINKTTETTHHSVDTLRTEWKQEHSKLDDKIGELNTKVDHNAAVMTTQIASVHTKLDTNTAMTKFVADQLPVLIGALASDRKITRTEEHWKTKSELETKAHEQMAKVDEGAKKRQWWRDVSGKAIAGVIAVLTSGVAIGYFFHSC